MPVIFVLRRGNYHPARMEYSYGRRAQSVTHSLHWKDVAVVEAESVNEAVSAAKEAIADWAKQGLTGERWLLEGRREYVNVSIPLREVS